MMTETERLAAFKAAVEQASAAYGVRLAVVSQIGVVVLDTPTLGYIVLPPTGDDVAAAETKEARA